MILKINNKIDIIIGYAKLIVAKNPEITDITVSATNIIAFCLEYILSNSSSLLHPLNVSK